MSRVKIVTPKRKKPLGVATSKGAFHLVGLTVIVVPVKPLATATTAASGGNREELLGPRPAGCKRQRSRRWEPQPGQWHRVSDDGEVGLRQSLSFVGKSGSWHRFLYLFVEVYGILILQRGGNAAALPGKAGVNQPTNGRSVLAGASVRMARTSGTRSGYCRRIARISSFVIMPKRFFLLYL